MSESLGLSVGVANLVAARAGRAPLSRSAVLTLFEHRPTEVGLPEENPNLAEPGLVLRGFVERVGDRAPLVAADGTKYLGEVLTVEAIESMARAVGYGAPVTIAIPAYWSDAQTAALREEFFAQPDLARDGVPPVLVSDATAALAALRTQPEFPADGIVALCDFGAGGTSVTLANAGSNLEHIGATARYAEFSGDAIDQLILQHLRSATADATVTDLAGTARIGSGARLLSECRRAKEQLSTAAVATLAAEPGEDVGLSRTELEQLISAPLERLLSFVEEVLRRNGIAAASLAAVATVGGGAAIPLVGARLSERFHMPILSSPQPAFSAAVGAVALGQRQASAAPLTTANAAVEVPTEMVAAAAASEPDAALAWSEDADDADDELVPYTGRDATGEYTRQATEFDDEDGAGGGDRLPWYKRTALVLTVAAAGAAVLVAVVLAINVARTNSGPGNPTQPAPTPTPQTVTVTGPGDTTTVTVVPAPPPTTEAPPVTTTEPPVTTTTTPPPTTTTTTTETTATTTAPPPPPPPTRDRLFPRFEPPWRR